MDPSRQQNKFLRLPVVEDKTGCPRSSIYLMVSEGTFPKPIKLGKRSVGWIESEVDDWIEQRIEESRQQGGAKYGN
ncbi:MAG: AlpA family transcriptional regulator [Gammaproteobacteria bacterium]|nr:AlpA family transcriptional regulator [Gammaproteobacteria bacterium]MCW5582967.1 AlpA family transcriptional regulator [Gammaproteobacteria bacterium]